MQMEINVGAAKGTMTFQRKDQSLLPSTFAAK
jgi:hypothetical protein